MLLLLCDMGGGVTTNTHPIRRLVTLDDEYRGTAGLQTSEARKECPDIDSF